MSTTYRTYLIIALILLIGVFALGYIKLQGVFGGTTVNLSLSTTDLNDGLVGWWTFDGADLINNAVDKSGQGNTGYLTGFTSTTTIAGKIGQALDFDGTDDYVDMGDVLDFGATDSFTIASWIKASSAENDIVMKATSQATSNVGYKLFIQSDSTIIARMVDDIPNSGTSQSVETVVDGIWHHIIAVFRTENVIRIYLDGVEVNYSTQDDVTSVDSLGNSVTLRIGNQGNNNNFFAGPIDDVRIYNRALSATEVKKLFELGGTTHINTSLNTTDLEDGLVGHWTFDGADLINNAVDKSGQGNTGYLTGFTSTTTIAGKIGQALEFDGSDDNVVITGEGAGFSIDIFTAAAWIYLISVPKFDIISNEDAGGDGWGIHTNASSQIRATYNAVTVDGESTLEANRWYHAVITADGTNVNVYVDGSFETSGAQSGSIAETTDLNIGESSYESSGQFTGIIDDVRIYDRALSATEIKKLFELGGTTHINTSVNTTDLESGLVGHWTFDGGDLINNAADKSGQGNPGYLTNFTSTTTVSGKIGQALEFDGDDDYVDLVNTPVTAAPITVCSWVKTDVDNVAERVVSIADVSLPAQLFYLGLLGATNDTFAWCAVSSSQTCAESSTVFIVGEWYHACGIEVSSTERYIYVNGVNEGTNTTSKTPSGIDTSCIGRACDSTPSAYLNGTLSTSNQQQHPRPLVTDSVLKTVASN